MRGSIKVTDADVVLSKTALRRHAGRGYVIEASKH